MIATALDSETAPVDLAAESTVLTHTPDASNPRIVFIAFELGDGVNDLDGTGGDFQVQVTVGGVAILGGYDTITLGTDVRARFRTVEFAVPANTEVVAKVLSPNAADTNVAVTATMYAAEASSLDSSAVQAAAAAALTADPSIAAILVDTGTTLPTQIAALAGTISTDVLAGLESVSITRVGPGYDATTGEITLVRNDDYLADNGRSIDLDLSGLTADLTGASGEIIATSEHYTSITGSASIVNVSGTDYLRLEWTRTQTDVEAGERHYDAVVILADKTRITAKHGKLLLDD